MNELNANGPNITKLFYVLYSRRAISETILMSDSTDYIQSSSCPPHELPSLFSCKYVTKSFAADDNVILDAIRNFLEPYNGCISNPTTPERVIVVNRPTAAEEVRFECTSCGAGSCELCLSAPSVSSGLMQALGDYLATRFTVAA